MIRPPPEVIDAGGHPARARHALLDRTRDDERRFGKGAVRRPLRLDVNGSRADPRKLIQPARLRTLSPPYHAQTGKSARTTAIQSASTRGAPARAGTSVPEAHHVPAILSLR